MNEQKKTSAAESEVETEAKAMAEIALRAVPYELADAALSELQRERGIRERCYGGWVSAGKLSRIDAKDRLQRIRYAERILALTIGYLYPAGDPAGGQCTGEGNEGCQDSTDRDEIPF